MTKKNVPQKGVARKWSERLKELGTQAPPKDIVDRLNSAKETEKRIAQPRVPLKETETQC